MLSKNHVTDNKLRVLERGKKDTRIFLRINSEFKEALLECIPENMNLSDFIFEAIFNYLPNVRTKDGRTNVRTKGRTEKKHGSQRRTDVRTSKKPLKTPNNTNTKYDFFLPCKKCGKLPCECDKDR